MSTTDNMDDHLLYPETRLHHYLENVTFVLVENTQKMWINQSSKDWVRNLAARLEEQEESHFQ